MAEVLYVDPADLHLPPSRSSGADPGKLSRQLSQYGISLDGMPPVFLYLGTDNGYMIYNGVTRATRAAKFQPGALIPAEVIGTLRRDVGRFPKVKERLP